MKVVKKSRASAMDDPGVVYIGRGSSWGNPFVIGKHGDRAEVIALYRQHLWQQLKKDPELIQSLKRLDGKDLACYCAPLPCHGDVLLSAIRWARCQH